MLSFHLMPPHLKVTLIWIRQTFISGEKEDKFHLVVSESEIARAAFVRRRVFPGDDQ